MDAFLDKLRIHFVKILTQLIQDTLVVLVIDDSDQNLSIFKLNLHLLVFDIVGVCEFAEEALNLVLQDRGSLLYDVLDIFENDILHLGRCEGHH